jgi:MFS family permease
MRRQGPLSDSYPAAAALVVFALVPYLALSTALVPLTPIITKSVGLSKQSFELTTGMANAAYAFGTVAAVQLALHLRGRRLLILYATLFVLASVLAAEAWTPGLFIAGRVTQGLCTSLMLIAAVPPLVIGWPASRVPTTAMTMNLCVFGAVAVGPVIGGVQAGANDWRPLFWVVAGIGVLALLFALLTFEDQAPADRSAPWDWVAQVLAGGGCAAAFFGASELASHAFLSLICFLPLCVGVAMLAALLVYEHTVDDPLMPVRKLTTTLPVSAIVVAMTAGAASVALVELAQTAFATRVAPTHLAMLFWPEVGAALASAAVFALVVRTRFIPVVALVGMATLAGGAAVLSGVATGPQALIVIGSGMVGIGVGFSVSPALFLAGFSQRSDQIQRVFALIELLRGAAAFMFAPLILHLAMTTGATPAAGIQTGIWICFGLAVAGGLVFAYLLVLGRVRLRVPRLDTWLDGDGPALESPRLAAVARGDDPLGSARGHARSSGAPASVVSAVRRDGPS